MRKMRLISLLLCMLPVMVACKKESEPAARLCIRLSFPELEYTKAGEGELLDPLVNETMFDNDLEIWVYACDANRTRLGYLWMEQSKHRLTQYEDRYFMDLSPEKLQVLRNCGYRVDVYAFGNREQNNSNEQVYKTFKNLSSSHNANYLDELTMTGSFYGITASGAPAYSFSSLQKNSVGLPFSGVGKNLAVTGDYPSLTTEVVTLKRAVSKIRFVTSQLVDRLGPVVDFNLNAIKLDGGIIPKTEFLFNDDPSGTFKIKEADGYVESPAIIYTRPANPADTLVVASNRDPSLYAYKEGGSIQDYEYLINDGIKKGALTDVGTFYLRETPRALSGTIEYSITGEPRTSAFSTPAGTFTRNHSWIVYFYFVRDYMKFDVIWTPWDPDEKIFDFDSIPATP